MIELSNLEFLENFSFLIIDEEMRFRDHQLFEVTDPRWKPEPTCFDSVGLRNTSESLCYVP